MSEKKSGVPHKLCPFSMSLALPVKNPNVLFKGGSEVHIKVGGPCAGPACMWWSDVSIDCVIFDILDELRKFNKPKAVN